MITLKDITKDYVLPSNTVKALKGINVSFRQNEFVAVLGPSGGGKTTLLNIVGGLDKYTSGDLIINGKSTANFKDREWDSYRNHSVGFVFQSYNLIPHQNVLSNVELALTISGITGAERKKRAIEALTSVGLADQCYKKPNQLSGGQMQRVAIARALVNNPDILLADEPTGALDTKTSVAIMEILKEVAKDRLVVMVTHNPDLAEEYATRIIRLTDGQIIDDSNPFNPEAEKDDFRYGKTNMNFLTALSLSLNNLLTKKGRTLLTAFAGSIGIIGIALILSLSTGVNKYIDDVQANSLSSYPLSVEKQTADMTGMLNGMSREIKSAERKDGSISETMVASEMFASVGNNDLRSLKSYLEENKEDLSQYLSSLSYTYGVTLNIYKSDTSDGIIQLNPSTLLSQIYGEYASYISSYASTFNEMIDDEELLKEQYDILYGRWPEKYDECMLVVYDKYTISDFLSYQIGLRNPNDFGELVKAAMSGTASELKEDGKSYTWQDICDMSYRVVIPADWYTYNSEFGVWENRSDDTEYMKKVLADSLELKIVGIVYPSDRTSSASLNPGIAYRSDLLPYMIEQAKSKEIIELQKANPEVDVFSGRTFEEINKNEQSSSMDFSSLISVDSKALSQAFGIDTSKVDINGMVENIINESVKKASSEFSGTTQLLAEITPDLIEGFFNYYIEEYGSFSTAVYNMPQIKEAISKYLQTQQAEDLLTPLADEIGMEYPQLVGYTETLLETVAEAYYDICDDLGFNVAALSREQVSELTTALMNDERVQKALSKYMNDLLGKKIDNLSKEIINSLKPQLANAMSKMFYIDGNKIASAFKFNMDEAEMQRIISSFLSTSKVSYSVSSNLTTLGYGDLDEPDSINFYFTSFEAKDQFKAILDKYNDDLQKAGKEESVISYTDITGILMSSITDIIDAISYVLIAFVSVSLIVSSIMIAIITYISVLERSKEIGILRSLGASKKDVKRVFNAETFIIGLASGVMGILVTAILIVPINKIIRHATKIQNIGAVLPSKAAMILIAIAVFLTIVAGLIPSGMAAKCDPVTALRSE